MIATDDPLVGVRRTGNFSDHVVNRFQARPIRFHLQVHLSGARADVISHAETATPRSRSYRSGNCRQQRFGIAVRNRQHRNFCNDRNIFQIEALGIFACADARCQRIAGINWIVGHAAALHAVARTPRACRKSFALLESIFVRIGINQAANCAVFRRNFRLDAAPGMAVLGNHDRAFYGDTQAIELLVILRNPVVHEHQRRRHVTINRIGVIRRQLFALLIRSGILRDCRLPQRGDKFRAAFD